MNIDYFTAAPNSYLMASVVDQGDGTGTRTTFDVDGNITSVEELTGLPIPEPTQEDRLAAVERLLDTMLDTEGASPAEKLIAAAEVRDNSIKAPGKGKL